LKDFTISPAWQPLGAVLPLLAEDAAPLPPLIPRRFWSALFSNEQTLWNERATCARMSLWVYGIDAGCRSGLQTWRDHVIGILS